MYFVTEEQIKRGLGDIRGEIGEVLLLNSISSIDHPNKKDEAD